MFAYPLTLKGEDPVSCAAGPGVGPVVLIFALPHMTPLCMERHNMFIHTAAYGRVSGARLNLVKEVPRAKLGQL